MKLITKKPVEADALAPHAKRPIRAFLRDRGDEPAHDAFWNLVFDHVPWVTFDVATVVAAELEHEPRAIAELLDGWRPNVLQTLHALRAERGLDPWEAPGELPALARRQAD